MDTPHKLPQPTVRLQSLSIGYPTKHGRRVVAHDLTADIHSRELTCLLGANGVGKSTLLRTLSAFQPKLDGQIEMDGQPIERYSVKQLSRMVAVVLTERCNVTNMRVHELVGLGRSPYTGFWGTLSKGDKHIVDDALQQVGIQSLSTRMVHTLSDGERQKVMIAKALAQQTPVIYLDEPTAFLDYPSKVEIMQLLHRIAQTTGKTVFLSTHDVELALQLADVVWLMSPDQGLRIGTPEDLALDGSLSGFFAGRGVSFSRETGLFAVDHRFTHAVNLTGKGTTYAMARKALHRNDIYTNAGPTQIPAFLTIQAEDTDAGPRIRLTSNNGLQAEADSIRDMLAWVRTYFQ